MIRPHPDEGVARHHTVLGSRQEARSQAPVGGSHGGITLLGVGRQVQPDQIAASPPTPRTESPTRMNHPEWRRR